MERKEAQGRARGLLKEGAAWMQKVPKSFSRCQAQRRAGSGSSRPLNCAGSGPHTLNLGKGSSLPPF